ncbi:winged helix-turn-helix domain-containing protein [Aeromonas sobria]|uniref:winged helix-turn-helix domain-containing protein n=1 Tax=Aeromonas sobria TaxID=646 RepID=UPI00111A19AA|nr:winged helix-turn-helix domain-containing protein [Aeromonas sobria]TNI87586.1 transcriptional regulator [Aeromonas sobria]
MTGVAPGNNISAYHFGDYVFDVKRRELIFCADKDNLQSARVVRLSSAESLIFSYLLDHHDEVCDKDLLLNIGWLGRPISPNSLNVAIANIRRHFASSPQTLDIRSTPKKGYSLHLNCKVKSYYGKSEPTNSEPLSEPEPAVTAQLSSMPPMSDHEVIKEPASAAPRSFGERFQLAFLSGIGRPMLAKSLMYVNLLLAVLVVFAASYLHFEWLHVHCADSPTGVVCQMEAKSDVPPVKPASLVLVSGHKVRVLSYKELEKTL